MVPEQRPAGREPILTGACDRVSGQLVLVDGRRLTLDVLEPAVFVRLNQLLVIHCVRMADGYAPSGQVVNVSPVSSSTRVTRASGMAPQLPTHTGSIPRAVSSWPHQPCMTGWLAVVRVRW